MDSGWRDHAQGAAKLIELRGEEQLSSPVGLELFTVVRFQNVSTSLDGRVILVPNAGLAGNQQCFFQTGVPGSQFTHDCSPVSSREIQTK